MSSATLSASPRKLLDKALRARNAGDFDTAVGFLRRLVEQAPKNLDGNFLLGTILAEKGDLDEGRRYLVRARELKPRSLGVLNNLGNVLRMLGQTEEALGCYRRVTEMDPSSVLGWVNLGFIYSRLERWQDCIASFRRVGGEDCGDIDILQAMAKAQVKVGQTDQAASLYRRILELDPTDRHGAALALAGLDRIPLPERHSDGMVIQTYRQKAAGWDQDVNRPGDSYFGPDHVEKLLAPWLPGTGDLAILDLGCGTGNCGRFLAASAKRLVGVDLSPEMLGQAAGKGLYSDLAEAEIGAYLAASDIAFDVVVGAGVFIMFSRLDGILSSVARRLKAGGLLALTLYRSGREEIEIRHNTHFGHSRAYVDRVVAECGFEAVTVAEAVHEIADGEEQPGFALLLRRV